MDIYGMSSTGQDYFGVDELLDFSNDEDHVFSGTADFDHRMNHQVFSSSDNNNNHNAADARQFYYSSSIGDNYNNHHHLSTDFADQFSVPSEEAAELEWLSKFVDDSVTNFPANNLAGTINFRTESPFHGRSRSKRTRAPSSNTGWTSTIPIIEKPNNAAENKGTKKRESYSSLSRSPDSTSSESVIRRCTHCASEKTPQWRTGPLGPKTLCNACGVRYKSGRLVPEYRPAASPTFVLTQHSNSHRKVMELRRQKELVVGQEQLHQHQQKPSPERQFYGGGGGGGGGRHHHHQSKFQVC